MLRDTGWRAITAGLGIVHAALALVWFGPWHGTPPPNRISAIQAFNEHVPWGLLFVFVAAVLLSGAALRKYRAFGHGIGLVLLGFFALLSLLGALPIGGQAVGSFVGFVLGTGLAFVHGVAQRHYVREAA